MEKPIDEWTDEDIDNYIIECGHDPETTREPFKKYCQALMQLNQHIAALAMACKLYYSEQEKAGEHEKA